MTFYYVAIGPNTFAFGDTREDAVRLCTKELPWRLIPKQVRDRGVVVASYAYLPEQDLAVSHIDGGLSWKHKDKHNVPGSREETIVRR